MLRSVSAAPRFRRSGRPGILKVVQFVSGTGATFATNPEPIYRDVKSIPILYDNSDRDVQGGAGMPRATKKSLTNRGSTVPKNRFVFLSHSEADKPLTDLI